MRSHNNPNSLHEQANTATTINQIGPMSQVASGIANMNIIQGNEMRNQKSMYNSKFT